MVKTLKRRVVWGSIAVAVLAVACSTQPTAEGTKRKETIHVLTQDLKLLTINAGQPTRVLQTVGIKGLPANEFLVGIDYWISRGVLYALARSGRVFTINTENGHVSPVGMAPPAGTAIALDGTAFGFDFNPAADRIRVISNTGQSLRLHPDTGALVAVDTPVAYEPGDAQANQKPQLLAAGYTYNKKDEKITTNFAIDGRDGTLVRQGSVEGAQPVVSPNTGRLFTVGALGTGPLVDASLDIADASGTAYAALRTGAQGPTQLYLVNLESGKAEVLGTISTGAALLGIAVIP